MRRRDLSTGWRDEGARENWKMVELWSVVQAFSRYIIELDTFSRQHFTTQLNVKKLTIWFTLRPEEGKSFKKPRVCRWIKWIDHPHFLLIRLPSLASFFSENNGKSFFSTSNISYYFIRWIFHFLLRCFCIAASQFQAPPLANSSKKMISSLRFFLLVRESLDGERIKNMIAIIFASDEIYSEPASLI